MKHKLKIIKGNKKPRTNIVYFGDNLEIIRSGIIPSNSIDMVYIDPPFCTQRKQTSKKPWSKIIHFGSYDDNWAGGIESYSLWLKRRIEAIYRLLKEDGSLFLHLDYRAVHYAKMALDEVFGGGYKDRGAKHLVNEIIWCYQDKGGGRNTNYYKRKHDTILWYSKNPKRNFKIQRQPLSKSTEESYKNLLNKYDGNITFEQLKKHHPGRFAARKRQGRLPKDLKEVFLSRNRGAQMTDWWTDITTISHKGGEQKSKEPYIYHTQKPISLLTRIIESATKEGDIVADFFCGCGVALTSANKLNRKWIGVDKEKSAISAIRKHLKFHANINPEIIKAKDEITKSDVAEMTWREYQDWAVRQIDGEPAKIKNKGADGFMPDGSWIEVKKRKSSAGIGSYRQVLEGLRKTGQAFIIAKSFSTDLKEKKAEILRSEGWELFLIPAKDLLRDMDDDTQKWGKSRKKWIQDIRKKASKVRKSLD